MSHWRLAQKGSLSMDATEFAAQLLDPYLSPNAFAGKDTLPRSRPSSSWRGTKQALEALGLRPETEVRIDDLAAVIGGRHVRTGAPALQAGSVFDLVFRAPNSVSLVWSQLDSKQRSKIEDAVLESALVILGQLIRHYPLIDGIRRAESFAASLILHVVGTRSATTGEIPPILHVHCCLFGVWSKEDGLVPPHEATLYEEDAQREGDAAGEAELAHRLAQLGWPIRNTAGTGNHSFELEGVPQALLDKTDFWKNTGCAG
jgi:TrwC relaxase